MSLFVEGLSLFCSFTLDQVIRVKKLFLVTDVTELSGTWDWSYFGRNRKAQIKINKIN